MAPELVHHVHGKSRVRVARTWREGATHHFVEWNVEVIIESDMAHAYKTPSNEGMTATDTTKNQCYVVAGASAWNRPRGIRPRPRPPVPRQLPHLRRARPRRAATVATRRGHGPTARPRVRRRRPRRSRRVRARAPPFAPRSSRASSARDCSRPRRAATRDSSETSTRGYKTRGIESWPRRWTPSGRTSDRSARSRGGPTRRTRVTDALTELFYGPPRGRVFAQRAVHAVSDGSGGGGARERGATDHADGAQFAFHPRGCGERDSTTTCTSRRANRRRISATVSSGGTFTPPAKL